MSVGLQKVDIPFHKFGLTFHKFGLILLESILGYFQQPPKTYNAQDCPTAVYMIRDGDHRPALYMYRVKTRLNCNKQQIRLGVLRFFVSMTGKKNILLTMFTRLKIFPLHFYHYTLTLLLSVNYLLAISSSETDSSFSRSSDLAKSSSANISLNIFYSILFAEN